MMRSASFAVVRKANQFAILRPEFQEALLGILGLRGEVPPRAGEVQGRAAYPVYTVDGGTRGILKHYRHGGWTGRLFGDLFFGLRRPVREFLLTERAAQRGIPTVTLLAARIQAVAALFYRGDVILREIPGARDLGALLKDPPAPGLACNHLIRAVARTVRRMHDAGLWHADLNLKNLLIEGGETAFAAYVIDLDRASLRKGPLGIEARARNLLRLGRSFLKSGGDLDGSLARRFLAAYCGRDRGLRARMRRQLGTLPLSFHLHRIAWSKAP